MFSLFANHTISLSHHLPYYPFGERGAFRPPGWAAARLGVRMFESKADYSAAVRADFQPSRRHHPRRIAESRLLTEAHTLARRWRLGEISNSATDTEYQNKVALGKRKRLPAFASLGQRHMPFREMLESFPEPQPYRVCTQKPDRFDVELHNIATWMPAQEPEVVEVMTIDDVQPTPPPQTVFPSWNIVIPDLDMAVDAAEDHEGMDTDEDNTLGPRPAIVSPPHPIYSVPIPLPVYPAPLPPQMTPAPLVSPPQFVLPDVDSDMADGFCDKAVDGPVMKEGATKTDQFLSMLWQDLVGLKAAAKKKEGELSSATPSGQQSLNQAAELPEDVFHMITSTRASSADSDPVATPEPTYSLPSPITSSEIIETPLAATSDAGADTFLASLSGMLPAVKVAQLPAEPPLADYEDFAEIKGDQDGDECEEEDGQATDVDADGEEVVAGEGGDNTEQEGEDADVEADEDPEDEKDADTGAAGEPREHKSTGHFMVFKAGGVFSRMVKKIPPDPAMDALSAQLDQASLHVAR